MGLLLAISQKRLSWKSSRMGGLVKGKGYGTTCGTTKVTFAPRFSAIVPARFSAAIVASVEVKITTTFRLDSSGTRACVGHSVAGVKR